MSILLSSGVTSDISLWDDQFLCTGFGNTYTYILKSSSQYTGTMGVPQSSTKGGTVSVNTSNFWLADKLPQFQIKMRIPRVSNILRDCLLKQSVGTYVISLYNDQGIK